LGLYEEVAAARKQLEKRVEELIRDTDAEVPRPFQSKAEQQSFTILKDRVFEAAKKGEGRESFAKMSLTHNEILYGFEADIVIRIPESGVTTNSVSGAPETPIQSPNRTINVELDGPFLNKQRFLARRDEYLSTVRGVEVIRMGITGALMHQVDEGFDVVLQRLASYF
jgi:hypothetical protein